MLHADVNRGGLYLRMIVAVLCLCSVSFGTITFTNNVLTYSSPSDLGTTVDPAGLNDVAVSYGLTKASFQALSPQVVAFNGAPAPGTPLNSLVANYTTSNTVTFTFAISYNYGSYTSYGRGGFSGSSYQDAISTAPNTVGGITDWLDASITSTGGRGVQALGFCVCFRNDQAVDAGQAIFTLSDATTATVTLPALGGTNPRLVFIGYQAPSGKTITRVQASHTSTVGGAWVAVDDLSFVMSPPASDTTAPAAVSNLATSGATASSVTLTWTAPGDDGSTGTATTYDIRYSTATINDANWASATQVSGEPAPAAAGTNQNMTVSGLSGDTTYYFAMKTADEVPNWSALSNVTNRKTSDTVAPAAVSNLATSGATASSVTLTWTAPGDNGSTGTAASYDIRYSTSTINDANWASATQATGEPAPAAAGTNQNMTVSGLSGDTTYYFAMKTADEVPNWSTLSNVTNRKTSDTVAPAAVNNMTAGSPTSSSLTLTWTAPGDNGSTGTAASYDIRYRTGGAVNDTNWASATQVSGEPAPAAAGSNQNMVVSGLSASTTYYFAIKTSDEVPNTSAISNSPSGTTSAGGTTWNVSTTGQLENAMGNYAAGDTISIADGTYSPTSRLRGNRGAVTVKGASGNRDNVIIQGPGMLVNAEPTEMFDITSDGVTIQDLTIRNVYYHGVHVRGENDADATTVRNVKIIDCGERFIKGSTNTGSASNIVDNLLVENCYFEQITALSGHTDNNYIGGIDMMGLNAPTIRNCTFKNIRGASGGGRGGIFLWQGINNPTIERNTFIGCDRDLCIGNPSAPGHVYMPNYHSTGGILRNNMVVRGAGIGVELCFTNNLKVYYNTIYSSNAGYSRTVSINDASGNPTVNLQLKYNIIRGLISNASYGSGNVTETGDITGSTPATTWFVAPDSGDLHLTASATPAFNVGVLLTEVPADYDNQSRSSTPDVGADEY